MARSIEEIKQELIEAKDKNTALLELTKDSKVSIWGLFLYVFAYGILTLEKLFDSHKDEVQDILSKQKVGTLKWYQQKCFDYRKGAYIDDNTGEFINTYINKNTGDESEYTDEQIAAQKIIKYASSRESNGSVLIKVAKKKGDAPEPLTNEEEGSFTSYFNKVKFAGTFAVIESKQPDQIALEIVIYRDPLLLTGSGTLVGNTEGKIVVIEAIKQHLQYLEFDGLLTIQGLQDALQKVGGVKIVNIKKLEVKEHGGSYAVKQVKTFSSAGYFSLDVVKTKRQITYELV